MTRTTALVAVAAVVGITLIVVVGMATGHNTSLATGGIAALAATLTGLIGFAVVKVKR